MHTAPHRGERRFAGELQTGQNKTFVKGIWTYARCLALCAGRSRLLVNDMCSQLMWIGLSIFYLPASPPSSSLSSSAASSPSLSSSSSTLVPFSSPLSNPLSSSLVLSLELPTSSGSDSISGSAN